MNRVKQIAEPRFPTRQQISEAMQLKLGCVDPLVSKLFVYPLAELAETLLLRQWREIRPLPKEEHKVEIRKPRPKQRAVCPACKSRTILGRHKYCPNCGTLINWITH